ncbi:hypothetical protein STRCI_000127 [Streptomyces cinnabarinus]|uniref:Lipoprotein n=1 Tax=Streptomyces cinnabarinus TaxID=67287 RepID=A0ABY7K885_9ACTN|nr:hypothetical protein [Streptomyces cinnabarinus]WAZ19101.1 hypothetical protein STRCI_000127 [Streptomyces cinnabarinus]
MRRTPALTSTIASSPRRPQAALATAVLAALVLTACGTEKTSAEDPQGKPAGTAQGRPVAAFTAMLDEVAQSCPPSAAPEAPPSGPAQSLPPGAVEVSPDVEPVAPTSGPEVELNARDWCASALHEERITQALWDLADPTPAKVRAILNNLGYIDERIHDLKQSGATTRFSLDLRDKGGRLCVVGTVAGENTIIDTCVAPVTGPFTPGQRKR